ncbi:DUF1868 domain-containing protein [Legionella sp. PC997]|uniref:DUF1868 domain-containing protein n=1 Tax=Legionella sp. PC997 TaxID=2755562 RepID=UPI0015F91B46|nr:DUF1868 domain-containing protein [Legionella sp. PC997]QMT60302.1 hypothetical protein HBNCFIEN_01674 [Legionella sp. PC997]
MFTLKNRNELQKKLSKVNEYGEYSLFPGVTVVSSCYPEHQKFCEAIFRALNTNPLIIRYFNPLPASSYHMTTMSLETEQQIGEEWNQFIIKTLPHYKKIKQTLQEKAFYPSIEKMAVHIDQCISLTLSLSTEQEKHIIEIAKDLNIEKTIPRVFHITLAYSRPNKTITKEHCEQLHTEITKTLNIIIEETKLPMEIGEPKLCYFNDMTAFVPWDADDNPFKHVTKPLNLKLGNTENSELEKESHYEMTV